MSIDENDELAEFNSPAKARDVALNAAKAYQHSQNRTELNLADYWVARGVYERLWTAACKTGLGYPGCDCDVCRRRVANINEIGYYTEWVEPVKDEQGRMVKNLATEPDEDERAKIAAFVDGYLNREEISDEDIPF